MAVPAADALVAGTPGFGAELAAEQRAQAPESLAANRAQLGWLCGRLTGVRTRLAGPDAMGVGIQVVGPMPMHHYWADPELAVLRADSTRASVSGWACSIQPSCEGTTGFSRWENRIRLTEVRSTRVRCGSNLHDGTLHGRIVRNRRAVER
jgi:hypothetical protein